MDALLRKLNHKPGTAVTVVGAPPEMGPALDRWSDETTVRKRLGTQDEFVVAFVKSKSEIAERAPKAVAALAGGGVLWMAYPKKSSKKYRSDVGRDDGWQVLGDLGFEPVRQIAIDDDWSALRFRKAEDIGQMVRDPERALSPEGRRRGRPAVVQEYLATVPEPRRPMIDAVDDVVRRAAPELEPALWQGMLGYGSYHYRYATGREGDTFVVGLANQKQYVSLYISAVVDGEYLAEANAGRLGKVSVGKSCIRFKRLDDLNLDVVAELVRQAGDVMVAP